MRKKDKLLVRIAFEHYARREATWACFRAFCAFKNGTPIARIVRNEFNSAVKVGADKDIYTIY